jgi:hypothetical protein
MKAGNSDLLSGYGKFGCRPGTGISLESFIFIGSDDLRQVKCKGPDLQFERG